MSHFTFLFLAFAVCLSSTLHAAGSFSGLVIPNQGQIKGSDGIRYYMDAPWGRVYVTNFGLLLNINMQNQLVGNSLSHLRNKFDPPVHQVFHQTCVLLDLPGAHWQEVIPEDPQITKLNFYYGNDSQSWVIDVPVYGRLRIKEIFPGTDLVLEPGSRLFWHTEGSSEQLPALLESQIEHKLRAQGMLAITGSATAQAPCPPSSLDDNLSIGHQTFSMRETRTLIWGTYLGGYYVDQVQALALDAAGEIIAVGFTDSPDFPAPGGFDIAYNGSYDIFVSKLSSDGKRLLWGSFLGGSDDDYAWSVALDDQNSIIVAGSTSSYDAPTTIGAFDTLFNGGSDIYVAKLSDSGDALMWGTYLGGSYENHGEAAFACAINSTGEIIVAGYTDSINIPVPGGFDTALGAYGEDIYLAKLASDGSALLWGTYLGGDKQDWASSLVLDGLGNLFIGGGTASSNIPISNAYDSTFNGESDIYVAKISILENKVLWATYIGGNGIDAAVAIQLDSAGAVYLLGMTSSPDIPTPLGYDTGFNGLTDMYVGKLSEDATQLIWGTYLGGSDHESPSQLTLTNDGGVVILGRTLSQDLPIPNDSHAEYQDIYLAKLANSGDALIWGTYFGGTGSDWATTVIHDTSDNLLVGGYTSSRDLPIQDGYDITYNGPAAYEYPDAFIIYLLNTHDPPTGQTLIIPAAARTSGAHGTNWRTDAMILNPTAKDICFDLHFQSSQLSETKETFCETRCIAANSSWSYVDILQSACKVPDESAGSLRIIPTGKLFMTSRTYNQTSSGTYGQFIKAESIDEGLRYREKGHLIGLCQNSYYRTNVGFTEITGLTTIVSIALFNSFGTLIQTTEYSIPPWGWKQVSLSDLGISGIDLGRAEVEVKSGGAVFSYASIIDNRTGDAIYLPLQKEQTHETAFSRMLPIVASTPGAYGTQWKSDAWIYNPYDIPENLTMVYETQSASFESTIVLDKFGYYKLTDIIATDFHEAGSSSGSLHLNFEHYSFSVSRTYNMGPEGTYGQMVPSSSSQRLIFPNETAWLLQLQCNPEYRSNVGFSEYLGNASEAILTLYSADGEQLGTHSYVIPPSKNLQVNDLFADLGVPCLFDAVYAKIENVSESAIFAYASVVDNRTGDAIFISGMK